jgi:molybdopterin-guanine dinucleotide biosynthesis protein A
VEKLAACIAPGAARPVVAFHKERQQNACALWPLSCRARLSDGVHAGELISLHHALAAFGAVRCPIDAADDAFFNVNTPDDLAMAETIARRGSA